MEQLSDDAVEEILLRFPPADPASLVRAALVCKLWCRIVCSPSFRRRFVQFHHVAPLLGLFCNASVIAKFTPTSSFTPPHADNLSKLQEEDWVHWDCVALDARHGLVLLDFAYFGVEDQDDVLVVWDPTTDERRQILPIPNISDCDYFDWNATVLCVPTDSGHLYCHDMPFVVVHVVTESQIQHWCLRVYSSEDAFWSEQNLLPECKVDNTPTALVGNTIYFMTNSGTKVLSFDLATRKASLILLPPKASDCASALMEKDGGLGFARVDMSARLSLWSMEVNRNGDMGWRQSRVIELEKLLVNVDSISFRCLSFAHAVGVFFMGADAGLFSFDLESGRVRKVYLESNQGSILGYDGSYCVVPYTGFCTPGHKKSLSDLLCKHNLPPGLFPRSTISYEYDESTSKLVVHLSNPCEVSFKDSSTIRYAPRVKATLSRGKLSGVEGMKTKVVVWVKVASVSIESDKICFITDVRQKDAYEVPREAVSVEEF